MNFFDLFWVRLWYLGLDQRNQIEESQRVPCEPQTGWFWSSLSAFSFLKRKTLWKEKALDFFFQFVLISLSVSRIIAVTVNEFDLWNWSNAQLTSYFLASSKLDILLHFYGWTIAQMIF